jgi:hypothetical protein
LARFQLHSLGFPVIRFELPADLPLIVAVEEYRHVCKGLHPEVFTETKSRGKPRAVVYQISCGDASRDGATLPWFHPQTQEPLERYMEEGLHAALPLREFARDMAGQSIFRKIHELETHVDVTFALYEDLTKLVSSGERGGAQSDASPEAELADLVYAALGPGRADDVARAALRPDGNPARDVPIGDVRRLVLEQEHDMFLAQNVPRPTRGAPQRALCFDGACAALVAAGQLATSPDAAAAYMGDRADRDDDQPMEATDDGERDGVEAEMEEHLRDYFGSRVKIFDASQPMADLGLADDKLELTLQVNLFR